MKNFLKRKGTKTAIKFFISGFFIWLLVIKINWIESWEYLQKIQIWQVFVYLIVVLLGIFISAKKWQKLCVFKKINDSFLNFFKLYLTGSFINNFVPSTIGGDIFRAYEIGKKEKKYSEAISTVVMDRFTGILSLMIMSPFFFLANFEKTSKISILVIFNVIILGTLFFVFLFLNFKKTSFVKKMFEFFPEKVKKFFLELNEFGSDRKTFFLAMVFSFVFNLVGVGLANLVLFWSLGVKINPLDYLSVIFVISIVSSFPLGIGFKEWSYIAFFAPFGISIPAVLMVAILNRFLQALINVFALPIYFGRKNQKLSKEKI